MNFHRIAFCAFTCLWCGAAIAESGSAYSPAAAEPQRGSIVGAGQRIFIDPETGKVRPPTAEERAQMARESAAAPKVKVEAYSLPDGTVVLPAEANRRYTVAKREADGKLTTHCADHPDERR
jgi:hypothetical protein